MKWLEKIVDDSLKEISKTPISMMVLGFIPEEMLDTSIKQSDDWRGWKAVESTISDEDINQFEEEIGYQLPTSFRYFLKYKYFFRLPIPDSAVILSENLPHKKLSTLKKLIYEYEEPELIIGRGYIYFASFEDIGPLCFDANEKKENNEYKIVFMDHEDLEDVHPYAANFKDLLESDDERGDRFMDYLNDFYAES
ncbi:MAG: SMI1/KNR4 family protein [Bacteroidota bacterium]